MLGADDTLALTGHPVGGVCPFGLATALPVYLDRSLAGFRPRLSCGRNAAVVGRGVAAAPVTSWSATRWVDLCRLPGEAGGIEGGRVDA